ncbi:MAG TPA: hypothetical protein VEA38_15035 [Terriglobales bacterium]|nr:hypothetical protein [Terriglobales bacterium]
MSDPKPTFGSFTPGGPRPSWCPGAVLRDDVGRMRGRQRCDANVRVVGDVMYPLCSRCIELEARQREELRARKGGT